MKYRTLGRTGWSVSEVSFGSWAIGSAWGTVDDRDSMAALHRALDNGVNSVRHGRRVRRRAQRTPAGAACARNATSRFSSSPKPGGRLDPHVAAGYNRANLTAFIDRSLNNLETEAIDLLQLHCPPTEVYYMPEVFGVLDDLVKQGKLRHYGVSVEKVEEALKAIEYPGVQSVQIIFNMFRQRPADLFFEQAQRKQVGILARVPLASGMLTGKTAPGNQPLKQTTTALSTGTANPSTAAKPLPGSIIETGLDSSGRIARHHPARHEHGAVCPALDPDVPGSHLRHSRRQDPRPGG